MGKLLRIVVLLVLFTVLFQMTESKKIYEEKSEHQADIEIYLSSLGPYVEGSFQSLSDHVEMRNPVSAE